MVCPRRKKANIQVGLDFGTSCSKVVYSELGKSFYRAIDFGHKLPNFPRYCLPSVAAIDGDDKLVFGAEAASLLIDEPWDSGFQRFKVVVAGNHDESFKDLTTAQRFCDYRAKHGLGDPLTPERLTACYLAYAMTKARHIIEGYPEYKDVELDVAFNICMPIDHLENNRVREAFEQLFAHAEAIHDAIRESRRDYHYLSVSHEVKCKKSPQERRVFAVPEAVAETASYVDSLRREEGIHAVIDLGAGTTDVSIFNLRLPFGDSENYWYAASNIPIGTASIERIIASHLEENVESTCTCREMCGILQELSLSGDYRRNPGRGELDAKVRKEMERLRASHGYMGAWGSAYSRRRVTEEWQNVEVFLCGGGANLPFAKQVFSSPWWNQIRQAYRVGCLPVPDDYDGGRGKAPFERMAVAYGLAMPLPTFGQYKLPADVPDLTPKLPRRVRLDRDELYPP